MASRPPQVIGNRPMAFEAELRTYQTGNARCDPSQLRMAEGVL